MRVFVRRPSISHDKFNGKLVQQKLSTDYRKKHGETLTREKRIRNRIYIASGSTILVSAGMLLAQWGFPTVFEPGPANWLLSHWTFIFECIALFAFGSAWLTKGRFADRMLLDESEEKELRRRGAS